jgi:hypothetical protein
MYNGRAVHVVRQLHTVLLSPTEHIHQYRCDHIVALHVRDLYSVTSCTTMSQRWMSLQPAGDLVFERTVVWSQVIVKINVCNGSKFLYNIRHPKQVPSFSRLSQNTSFFLPTLVDL